jgi:hypothetical protein
MTTAVEPRTDDGGLGVPLRPASTAPASSTPPRRVARTADDARLPMLIVFAVVLALGMLAITPHPLGVFTDDAMYAILGKSLAEGQGYRFINLPGAPSGTHFPPVYPLLLAAIWKLVPAFPQNVLVFKAVNALLNALAAVLTFRLGERVLGLPRWLAGGAAILAGVAVPSLLLAGMVLSEPLFLVLLLAALPFAERVRHSPTTRGALLLGALGGLLMLTRSIGIAFIVGSVVALLLARHWRHALLVAAAAALFVVPWQRWTAAHDAELPPVLRGKYGSYTGWLSSGVAAHGPGFVVGTVVGNVRHGAVMTVEALRPPRTPWSLPLALVAGAVVLVVGGWRLARRAPVTLLVTSAYVGVVMLWPFDPTRFLWGMWPLVILLVASTIAQLLPWARGSVVSVSVAASARAGEAAIPEPTSLTRSRVPHAPRVRRALAVAGLACALVLAGGATAHATFGYSRQWYSTLAVRREVTARPVLEWVLATTAPTDVVASDEESMVYLYTGRLGMPATRFTPDEHLFPPTAEQRARDLQDVVRHYRPDWIVTTASASRAGAALLVQRPTPALRVVDSLPSGGYVLRPVTSHE